MKKNILKIKQKIKVLPKTPGCYLMKDKDQKVIYIGKAKNLKNRVASYFTGAHNQKTTRLISNIFDFDFLLTNNENESLILELNLIKKYQPKYNIRLVDDKTYPYIQITDEKYPMLRIVREKNPTGKVFGPYPSVFSARETVKILNRIYPFRKCEKLPDKACLYFHIGECLAPCVSKDVDYKNYINQVTRFLKGETKPLIKKLQNEMELSSEMMLYEKAAKFRDMINHIKETTKKQFINLNDGKSRDVIAIDYNEKDISLEIFMLNDGKIIDHIQKIFSYIYDPFDFISTYLNERYINYKPEEILADREIPIYIFDEKKIKFSFPEKGPKKKLVDLAKKNAKENLEHNFMLNRYHSLSNNKGLEELSKILTKNISKIDIIDNSQLFGQAAVSVAIVYNENKFDKKMYRKYHLQNNKDDYNAMKEVVYRRYFKILNEQKKFPDLILVDGGLGQINAAKESLDILKISIPVVGLKKDKRHNLSKLVLIDREIHLDKKGKFYRFLVSLSEEVHRFAISFHKKTRDKGIYASKFDKIPGVGPKKKALLIKNFGTYENLKNVTNEELKKIGISFKSIEYIRENSWER